MNAQTNTEEYISIMEAARRVGRSDKQVRRWIHAGKLPARYPRPNLAEIAVKDLEAFLSGQTSRQNTELSQQVLELENQIHILTNVNKKLEREIENNHEQIRQVRHLLEAQGRQIMQLFGETGVLHHEQEQAIEEAEKEAARLRNLLDVERRYMEDVNPRPFKAWLKKQPSSPWRDRVLSDQLVPARGSRALYEAHVRRLCPNEEEREDFVRLWKLMLLSRP